MKRLTFDGNFCDIAQCRELTCPCNTACTQRQVWEKLKAYEDLGFEPEEYKRAMNADIIVRAAAVALGVAAERLRELTEADKGGRVVVLPCKVGDTVYTPKRPTESRRAWSGARTRTGMCASGRSRRTATRMWPDATRRGTAATGSRHF